MSRPCDPWRRAACALAVTLAALLSACSDGYPSQDVPAFEPERMTLDERMDALAALGRSRTAVVRFRYEVDATCGLTVERKPRWQSAERTRVLLRQADVALRTDGDRGVFGAVAVLGSGDAVPLYEGRRRVDALHAVALLRLLQRDCVEVLLT